ncbi:MAG: metallo-beta-lactamase family protein [Algoriphagus sp.]
MDYELFQGRRDLRQRNWDKSPMPLGEMEAIVLTHAQLDHIGSLPQIVKQGFKGPIYCTEATAELAKILLLDSGKLQEEETEYAKKKGYSRHDDPQTLYTQEDAEAVFPILVAKSFGKAFSIHDSIEITFYNAGHILGAFIVNVKIKGESQTKTLVFSGDLGRYHDPILFPVTLIPKADIIWIESTFEDRKQPPVTASEGLASTILDTFDRGGLVIIPAFSVGRTQLVLYYLFHIMEKGKIPKVLIFLDCPMVINAIKLCEDFHKDHKINATLEEAERHPFKHPQLHYYQKQEQSKSLNGFRGNAIILSASGMATGG